VPIWIGGRGEKRTLRAAARYADGWNCPYVGPAEWKHKDTVLDQWCEKEGRDPRAIQRTVNVGFYLGADAKGAARAEALYQSHFGKDPREGFLRGTPEQARQLVAAYRDAGVQRLNIALRQGPYDWEALQAYAEHVLPAFGATRPA
jgi:alkanesulfonate monooxygenase SsuD/methylene tetrahydromethanopterin reductase-like flavin-dependent oxidoreductase (luciferase family)